jgi:hypothetical protein
MIEVAGERWSGRVAEGARGHVDESTGIRGPAHGRDRSRCVARGGALRRVKNWSSHLAHSRVPIRHPARDQSLTNRDENRRRAAIAAKHSSVMRRVSGKHLVASTLLANPILLSRTDGDSRSFDPPEVAFPWSQARWPPMAP